ncbi:Condensin complex subunit [Thalictrum thalictroides]|uniref:Condensin complex subunit 2 n=1 Tax=Thalictrum thalictroides TaxID=46969 RepID=A0A7J6VTY1_THATH|nr:Condensin complex subunit [Thalictrum thalictroides]
MMTEIVGDGDHIGSDQEGCRSKKEIEKKISPLSTLESSFEALNVKKFDVAFTVDPLYHQTSAQFDEGGAKGLLLNNLGVYGGCWVVFDSFEVPGKTMFIETRSDLSDTVDAAFAKDCIEQMLINIPLKDEISPTLRSIINMFDEDNRRASNTFFASQKEKEHDDAAHQDHADLDTDTFGDALENGGDWGLDQDDHSSLVDESFNHPEQVFQGHHEEYDSYAYHDPDNADNSENVADILFFGLGFASNRNAWAGPDHWKFRKGKGSQGNPETPKGSPVTAKKSKYKKQPEPDINFTNCLGKEMPDIFAPKNPKSLLLPASRVPCSTTLPEDCHYEPENLVKLFLLPNTLVSGNFSRNPFILNLHV